MWGRLANLITLVLPAGAVSGARIVLDGINGIISVYNASDKRVGTVSGTGLQPGFKVGADLDDDTQAYAMLDAGNVATTPRLLLRPADELGNSYGVWGYVVANITGGGTQNTAQGRLQVTSPVDSTQASPADAGQINLVSRSHDGTTPSSVDLIANQVTIAAPAFLPSQLLVTGGATFEDAQVLVRRNTSGDTCYACQVTGETFGRLLLAANGLIKAGPGTGATDTRTFRGGVGVWASDPIRWNNANAAETWHALTLAGNFANRGAGFPVLSYQQVPSPAKSVFLIGQVVSGVTVASGTQIATLPVGYRPTTEIPLWAWNATTLAALGVTVGTGGAVKLFGTWANGDIIHINGLIPLDI